MKKIFTDNEIKNADAKSEDVWINFVCKWCKQVSGCFNHTQSSRYRVCCWCASGFTEEGRKRKYLDED